MNELVSIITPCYNGASFVFRLLDSILLQSYSAIELIVVDDGSTDGTREIVFSYIPKFRERNFDLRYIYQENAGQAAALNNGLKLFKGTYVTWPDSDDFYNNGAAIQLMVGTLKELSGEYGMVRSDALLLDEESLKPIRRFSDHNPSCQKEELFMDCLMEKDFWYTPGCYMTTKKIIEEVIRDKSIFVNRSGQNWQMYLPILYKYKCKYIDKTLFNYLVRKNSHSRENRTYETIYKRTLAQEELLEETIKRMDISVAEEEKLLGLINKKFLQSRTLLAFRYGNKEEFQKYYLLLNREFHTVSFIYRIANFFIKFPSIILYINQFFNDSPKGKERLLRLYRLCRKMS